MTSDNNEYKRPEGHNWRCECPECLVHWESYFDKYERAYNAWYWDKVVNDLTER
jgi:hypothetical protein